MSESPAHRRPGLIALVAIGGVAGTFARHGLGQAFPHSQGDWPITTFLINVAGAFALGLLLEALTRLGAPDAGTAAPRAASSLRMLRLGMGTGVLGAFTTYSTLAVDTDLLVHDGHVGSAVTYALATVVVGLISCTVGIAAGARFGGRAPAADDGATTETAGGDPR